MSSNRRRSSFRLTPRRFLRSGLHGAILLSLLLSAGFFSGPVSGIGRLSCSESKTPLEENTGGEEVVIVIDTHAAPRRACCRVSGSPAQGSHCRIPQASAARHVSSASGHRLANGLTAPLRC